MRSDEDEERYVSAEEGSNREEGSAQLLPVLHLALRSHQVKLKFNDIDCTD